MRAGKEPIVLARYVVVLASALLSRRDTDDLQGRMTFDVHQLALEGL
jgi:hypothetical protein